MDIDWLALGYWGLFLVAFLSATIIPFSSDVIVAGMVALGYNPYLVLLIATVGNTLGGLTNYIIGRLGKLEWIEKYLRVSKKKLDKASHYVERFSTLTAFFTWFPGIGDAMAIVLGLFKISPAKVIVFMTLGKLARYFVIIFVMKFFVN